MKKIRLMIVLIFLSGLFLFMLFNQPIKVTYQEPYDLSTLYLPERATKDEIIKFLNKPWVNQVTNYVEFWPLVNERPTILCYFVEFDDQNQLKSQTIKVGCTPELFLHGYFYSDNIKNEETLNGKLVINTKWYNSYNGRIRYAVESTKKIINKKSL